MELHPVNIGGGAELATHHSQFKGEVKSVPSHSFTPHLLLTSGLDGILCQLRVSAAL
jgi:hypothetical protein